MYWLLYYLMAERLDALEARASEVEQAEHVAEHALALDHLWGIRPVARQASAAMRPGPKGSIHEAGEWDR